MNIFRSLVQTGQQYIIGSSTNEKNTMVKIDKSLTILETKYFNQSQLDPNKCIKILSKLIYLLNRGQKFTQDQTNSLFFSITKLLQTQDVELRRMVYMIIKQLKDQPSIYIVTSSLLKDINHKNASFRRNALRTIPMVIDTTNIVQVERYIKNLINDNDISVSSAAIISGIQFYRTNQEIVKKWVTDIIQKLNNKDCYIQFQSLVLIGQIKHKDFNSLKKMLLSLMKNQFYGVAAVQLLRMLKEVSKSIQYDSLESKEINEYIHGCIKNKDDFVMIQAAKFACESTLMTNKDLIEIIKVLQPLLSSQSIVKKYTILKIYNNLLKNISRKSLVVNTNEIQKVLHNKNTSLSSIAASILLRICTQQYLQKLLKELIKNMINMSIDNKIDIIKALQTVLYTYPKHYKQVNQLLQLLMNKEKDIDIKLQIISIFNYQIQQIGGQSKIQSIKILSKFLSQIKYHKIHFQILGIITKYITNQEINNQLLKNIILEIYFQQGDIRACGLSTLIKLNNLQNNKMLEKIINKFKNDQNQQVRDRIIFRSNNIKSINQYQLDLIQNYLNFNCRNIQNSHDINVLKMTTIHKWGQEVGPSIFSSQRNTEVTKQHQGQQENMYKEIFANHSTFQNYGKLKKINRAIAISDPQSQLQVWARIFLFESKIVIEFKIHNKFPSTQLQDVRIELKHSGQTFQIQHIIPIKSINYSTSNNCYIGMIKKSQSEQQQCEIFASQKFNVIAKYTVNQLKNNNKNKKIYQDQYSLQDFQIQISTYISTYIIDPEKYIKVWDELQGKQLEGTFSLNYASTQAAMNALIKHFGMRTISTSDSNSNLLTVSLAGKYLGDVEVLVLLILAYDTKRGCLLKIKAKSPIQSLTEELIESIS